MYSAVAAIATMMLDISVKFCDASLVIIDKMTTEHAACHPGYLCHSTASLPGIVQGSTERCWGLQFQRHSTHWTLLVACPADTFENGEFMATKFWVTPCDHTCLHQSCIIMHNHIVFFLSCSILLIVHVVLSSKSTAAL
jgi:hypothetical protein